MKRKYISSLFTLTLILINMAFNKADASPAISYKLTFPEAQAHYVEVEMNITGLKQNTLDLKMPVWTPGSYLVREFSKNVESFSASAAGKMLPSPKVRKNCWRINTTGLTAVTIKYKVYCFEISVRTSFIDASHAFISSTGIFVYPDGLLDHPSTITVVPHTGWSKISTSLQPAAGDAFTVHAPNYDILFDSPIEVGNQDVFGFDSAGCKYEVAMCGGGNYNKDRLKNDMAKIVETEAAIFGENPNKRYVFIVHNYARGGGGLEHLSSTVLGASRDNYASETGYLGFLGLVAHEHFHLWNVKRLRPIALGPFDYDNENYTTDLWIAEGFTAYYQNKVLRHAGLTAPDNYLNAVAAEFNIVENQPGAKVQSLADASYDSWIKSYRPNENTFNTTISYYDKGAIVGLMLDLEVINDSKGKYSLDDVMRFMYDTYYKQQKRGYTDQEFKRALEQFAGKSLTGFYEDYITGLTDINYNKYLGYAGYKITNELDGSNDASLGIGMSNINGKKTVTMVARGSAAWIDGINVNDEITAIDGLAVTDGQGLITGKNPGDKIAVTVNRDGLPLTLQVTLLKNPRVKYRIDPLTNADDMQLMVRKKWLKL